MKRENEIESIVNDLDRSAFLVTSSFFVPSVLNTSKEKFISFVWILLSLTNCSSIPVCVYPESTSAFTFSFFPFLVLTFAYIFNSFFPSLVWWFGIMYLFWIFTWEIFCTMPTRDLHQNLVLLSCCLHRLILLGPFSSSLSTSLYNLWQYAPSCCIWNMFVFLVLSFLLSILLPYIRTCCSWST